MAIERILLWLVYDNMRCPRLYYILLMARLSDSYFFAHFPGAKMVEYQRLKDASGA